MKQRVLVLGVVTVLTFMVMVPGAVAGDMESVENVLRTTIDAFNARDFDTYYTYLTDDFEAFTGVESPLVITGKAGWQKFFEGTLAYAMAHYEQHHSTFRIYNGDTAVGNGYFDFTVFTKDGQAIAQSGRVSVTLVKLNGKWLIANFHFSAFF